MDNRLNPDFIMSNVEKIFNEKSVIKKYKVIYDDLEANVEQNDEEVPAYIVVSGSNKNECIFFYCYKYNEKYYLQTQGIHKCNNEPSSGKFNIFCLLDFCKKFDYDYMVISEDRSQLFFNFIEHRPLEISLMKLKLLTNAISWYNSLGFYADNNINQILQMKQYINLPIATIMDKNPNITDITNYILNLTKLQSNSSIASIFKKINSMIQNNCHNYNCEINFYETLKLIGQFINVMYELSGIDYDVKNLTYKINKNGEDDIEEYLGGKTKLKKIKKQNRKTKNKRKTKKNKKNKSLKKKHYH